MKRMKRKVLSLFLVSVMTAVLGLTGCQKGEGTDSEEKKEEQTQKETEDNDVDTEAGTAQDFGTLKIGMDGAHAPYCAVNEETGELEGFEVDVMNEICRREGIQIELEVASWEGIFGMLDSGQLTSIACSVEPNEERKEKYDFTESYISIDKSFAVAKGKGQEVTEIKDLQGKKVGCRTGGNSVQQLEELMAQEEIVFEIVPYDGGGMEYDLSIGRLDALYAPAIATQASIDSGEFEIEISAIEPVYPAYCAYPFAKGKEDTKELIQVYNKALKAMKEDGTLEELSMKWFHLDAVCD